MTPIELAAAAGHGPKSTALTRDALQALMRAFPDG
jgi:uncharacterized phage protein (TIGR02216 family)